jgi:hypothetical protein
MALGPLNLLEAVSSAPLWHPDRIDFDSGHLRFVRMDRESFRRSSFLDHRIVCPTDQTFTVAFDTLRELPRGSPACPGRKAHFIFHHAFCGSTLLTRCLDALGACLPLREPFVLHQLSSREVPDDDAAWEWLWQATLALLSRTFDAAQISVIKPSDYSSARITELLAVQAGSRALFLHTGLEEFIAQILKLEDRRRWAHTRLSPRFRQLLASIDEDAPRSDGEVAAALWFAQTYNYGLSCDRAGGASLRSLDFRRLLTDPEQVVTALADWFGISVAREELAMLPAIMRRSAKRPTARYDHKDYDRDIAAILARHHDEVSKALRWMKRIRGRVTVLASLPRPLLAG